MDEQNLAQFRSNWVECLGDIARYRIAVTALLENQSAPKTLPANAITQAALSGNHHLATGPNTPDASVPVCFPTNPLERILTGPHT